jgi:response regulator RpfG family c-di-GMP phosphodiesterase
MAELAMAPVARVVRSSHERWDGTGYPDRLAGDDIPFGARVILICDAYDAMLSGRPYRRPRTSAEALAELRRHAGTHFDPELVEVFCERVEAGEIATEPGNGAPTVIEPATRTAAVGELKQLPSAPE